MAVYVTFSGLCTVVEVLPGRVKILLPNFSNADEVHGRVVPAHAAAVTYRPDEPIEFKDYGRVGTFSVDRPEQNTVDKVLLLNGEKLSLRRESGGPKAEKVDFNPKFIVAMKSVIDEGGINSALVSTEFDPPPDVIAAVVDVSAGALYGLQSERRFLEFRPARSGHAPYRGQFSETIMWEMPSGKYEMQVASLGFEGGPRTLLTIDGTGADVYLHIVNFPLADLVKPTAQSVLAAEAELVDHHFHRFYELTAKPSPVHPLPYRVSAPDADLNSHGGNCPPVVFEI